MQKVYDKANELAAAIRESDEYRRFVDVRARASQNAELAAVLNDFHEKQFDIQKKTLLGEDAGAELQQQMQMVGQILMKDPLAAEYLQAELSFTKIVNDVYTVLADVVKL
jgi:cell fate (sporulation/competence/biofilm development) regulator YlbF (YheA/YmcA/DUF963 family)